MALIRIVKMTFSDSGKTDFLKMFEEVKTHIRAFEGCEYLELLNDQANPNIYFTYSKWQGPENLENYRQSALFAKTWKLTKTFFAAKPEAWSVDSIHRLP